MLRFQSAAAPATLLLQIVATTCILIVASAGGASSVAFAPSQFASHSTSVFQVRPKRNVFGRPSQRQRQRHVVARGLPAHRTSASSAEAISELSVSPSIAETDTSGILASLFGSPEARDDFFANDFGRNVVHIRRTQTETASSSSSSAASNSTSRTTKVHIPSPIPDGIDMKSLYESNQYISLRSRGSQNMLDKESMNHDDVRQYISGGGSVVVPIIDGDYLYPLKEQVEQTLGGIICRETSMNVYHSGHRAVALNRHYDAYDVFVLQTDGEKEWEINMDNNTRWTNVTMVPGDLLYIPKGIFHAATTAEGSDVSTHVTIGLIE